MNDLRDRGAEVHGADIAGERVDLSTAEGNRQMVSHVVETAGRLDILILNAGCQFVAPSTSFQTRIGIGFGR